MSRRVLVVGAGFAGAIHARELADRGFEVDVIDQRSHIAGNAFDEVSETGVRVHRYGPHLFHTNLENVVAWLGRFGTFVRYEHKVQAQLPGGHCVPLPINRRTINVVFGIRLKTEVSAREFLAKQVVPHAKPANAADYLHSVVGVHLTELFFRPYTRKMWALELEDIAPSVVMRLRVRYDDEDRYFPKDRFQLLPRDGYTTLFERIFDHPKIRLTLNQGFDRSFMQGYAHCFNSMAIDEYFNDALGPLPYRSIRFHHSAQPSDYETGRTSVTNFTGDERWTRETDWSRLPHHRVERGPHKTITREEPCDYRENNLERYYPVMAVDGRFDKLYNSYKSLANKISNLTFIGRCGTYRYLDMHQVINQSLKNVRRWICQNEW